MLDALTLDQLRVLVAIADAGSFTAAARQIRRAQSAVSHAVANLEATLEVKLFDRSSRKPAWTPAGEAILAEARMVLVRAERLRATARRIAAGQESEIVLATGVIVPEQALINALDAFRLEFPTIALTLFREELGGPVDLVAQGKADLGFDGAQSLRQYDEDVFDRRSLGTADVVSVAAPNHPLTQCAAAITDAELANHRQLVPTSRTLPRYEHALVHDTWAVADLHVRYRMIVDGMGWGTVPLALAESDLKSGILIELSIEARPAAALQVPLFAVWRTGDAPGPASLRLIELARAALAD
ncbi:MAG: LysR substrate-binding domain-containing protein [Woeseiaceae bacterium]|nr:LysR substrate-binding domain-containing protein [Woeseiaceae bacterium]